MSALPGTHPLASPPTLVTWAQQIPAGPMSVTYHSWAKGLQFHRTAFACNRSELDHQSLVASAEFTKQSHYCDTPLFLGGNKDGFMISQTHLAWMLASLLWIGIVVVWPCQEFWVIFLILLCLRISVCNYRICQVWIESHPRLWGSCSELCRNCKQSQVLMQHFRKLVAIGMICDHSCSAAWFSAYFEPRSV
jgi:hypothetical protein